MDTTADIVIVGGGIMGSALAYWLTRLEPMVSVVVVERDPTYSTASSALSAASIRQQFTCPVNIRISQASIGFLRGAGELLATDGVRPDIGLTEAGYLYLADSASVERLREAHAVQIQHGAEIAFLRPTELARQFPWLETGDLAGGTLGVRAEGWFDGYTLLTALARKARSQGARFLRGEVTGVDVRRSRVETVVLADGSRLRCGRLINAAGPWARSIARLAGVELPVYARRRTVYVVSCRAEELRLAARAGAVWGGAAESGGAGFDAARADAAQSGAAGFDATRADAARSGAARFDAACADAAGSGAAGCDAARADAARSGAAGFDAARADAARADAARADAAGSGAARPEAARPDATRPGAARAGAARPGAARAFPLLVDPSGFWIRPEGNGFIAGIGPEDDPDDAPLEPEYEAFESRLWPALAARVPAFEAARLERAWAGYYDMNVFDHNGIVGFHPEVPNLGFMNGFSGHGMQQGPVVGMAMAELILHGRFITVDLGSLAYERIVAGRPLRELNIIG